MSWSDRKPFVVTEEHMKAKWSGVGNKIFRCGFCGHKFKIGDVARWVFTNHTKAGGNPFICQNCDDVNSPDDAVRKWEALTQEYHDLMRGKFWWFKCHYVDVAVENAKERRR